MCVIILLPKNFILPYDLFENACFNNWHSYGIILKENNLVEVKKDCPKKGNDPEKIYKILEDNKDVERFVHLRFKTEGDVDLENTQPFPAFYSDKKQIYFMHNGTLHDFKPPTTSHYGHWNNQHCGLFNEEIDIDEESVPSDSRKFCETVLNPLLLRFDSGNGKGDIKDPVLERIISKFFGTVSKGILVANDQEPLLLNEKGWETIKVEGGEFIASNNDYFRELKRGPVFEARKKQKEEQDKKKSTWTPHVDDLKSAAFNQRYALGEEIVNLLEDYDLYSEQGYADLANLTYTEIEKFIDNVESDQLIVLFMCLTDAVKQSHAKSSACEFEISKLEDKLKRASTKVAELVEMQRTKEAKKGGTNSRRNTRSTATNAAK